jgi:hypothetical protein
MQHARFNGYGKPVLAVRSEKVVVTNVPVPRSMEVWAPRLVRAENALSNLSITRLLRGVFNIDSEHPTKHSIEANQKTANVLSYMLEDLKETNVAKHSVLVLAYLPFREDLEQQLPALSWRNYFAQYAREHGLLYLDLTNDFRRLPPAELDKMFIAKGAVDFPGVAGHYTDAGNAFVADLIYRGLLANRDTAAKLYLESVSTASTPANAADSHARQ